MPLYLLVAPFVLLYELLVTLAPIIGISIAVVAIIAAVLSLLVLIFVGRRLVRSERLWVRNVGRGVMVVETLATLGFLGAAAVAIAAVAIYA